MGRTDRTRQNCVWSTETTLTPIPTRITLLSVNGVFRIRISAFSGRRNCMRAKRENSELSERCLVAVGRQWACELRNY